MELSSYFPLDAYSLKMADMDQYLGMNNLNYNGRQCHLINWRTASSKGADTQEIVLLDAGDISKVITKGRALENNVGAHNLYVADPGTTIKLRSLFPFQVSKSSSQQQQQQHNVFFVAYGIGGEYHNANTVVGSKKGKGPAKYKGVSMYGLQLHRYGSSPDKLWSSLEWKELALLFNGDHKGNREGRDT